MAFSAEKFNRPVGDDFVGVHVRLGTGSCLPDDEGKIVVELAVNDLAGGLGDGRADLLIDVVEINVGERCSLFDDSQRPHKRYRHRLTTDLEVLE